ncbi:hypothetical protein [Rice orange leaf phytoplasma]|uniref:hypothetical protein n=1 Tax=Rice orange leaf phytoplasma TaxID=146897 RepID=UPI0008F5F25E|nr:hypothetical protein [Rice orange leaf phytoplasma]OIJ44953.1 hypothetical protein BHE82_00065 [Rice orange leaf phytoplasma]
MQFKNKVKGLKNLGLDLKEDQNLTQVQQLNQCFEKVDNYKFKIKYQSPQALLEVLKKLII